MNLRSSDLWLSAAARQSYSAASSFSSASSVSASSGVSWSTSIARSRRRSASSCAAGAWKQPELLLASDGVPLTDGRPPRDSSSRSSAPRISRARATTARRQAGEPRDLDAVAAIGAARHDLAQEDDVVLPLARGDVEVDDAGRARRRGRSARGSAWRTASSAAPSGWSPGTRRPPTRCSGRRRSRCRGRSRRGRRGCATSRVCRMFAVSCISTMKVDWPRAMLSDAPTRAKMRSTIGSFASRAGTNEPACAIRQSSAVCRR